MESKVQQLAAKNGMYKNKFMGEMRKRGCSEPTALKGWKDICDEFDEFEDNDMNLSNLCKAADVLKVNTLRLLTS